MVVCTIRNSECSAIGLLWPTLQPKLGKIHFCPHALRFQFERCCKHSKRCTPCLMHVSPESGHCDLILIVSLGTDNSQYKLLVHAMKIESPAKIILEWIRPILNQSILVYDVIDHTMKMASVEIFMKMSLFHTMRTIRTNIGNFILYKKTSTWYDNANIVVVLPNNICGRGSAQFNSMLGRLCPWKRQC